MVRMILDGLGVGFIAPAVVAAELERGDLRLIETGARLPDLNFTAAMQLESDRSFLEPILRLAQLVTYEHEQRALDKLPLCDPITD